jgi:hypothetical protein
MIAMGMRWWFASTAVVSILLLGGCGSVTSADGGTGGSAGTAGSGSSGSAGTTGDAGRGGGGSGGRGGVDGTAGTSGSAGVTGAGARGGTTGTGGAGAIGTGGVAAGGRGGTTGTAGTTGTGGIANGGRGGATAGTGGGATAGRGGTTGVGGTGGVAIGGRGGGNAGTGGGGVSSCPASGCPPLMISDLLAIDASGAPAFDATGFRCKSLTICPNSSSCLYFSTDMFGSLQSMDSVYTDGAEVAMSAPTKLRLDTGAASQCGNPSVTFTASDTITIQFDGGKKLVVLLPAFMGTSLTLYIATDGSTYYDAALTQPARRG